MKNDKTYSTEDFARTLLTRRQFLQFGVAATAAVALPMLVGCEKVEETPNGNFPQPKTISSVSGVLQTTLLIKTRPATVNGKSLILRTYGSPKTGVTNPDPDKDDDWDWSFPGPTLRVNRGDRIQLTLLNYLEVIPPDQIGVCEPA